MRKFFTRFKKVSFDDIDESQAGDEYLELNTESPEERALRVMIRPFVINDFSDVKPILDTLREGSTIALVNIRPLKEKDLVELKRAINKLKKTTEAIEGDIAGFGDDYIIVAPQFAEIFRGTTTTRIEE